jgi:hypothetical protein
VTRDQEVWEHDIRPPILRKIQAAKDHGRGVNVSPYWLSKILDRLNKYEPPKAWQTDLRLTPQPSRSEK